jgi:hypothetical protein
MHDHDDFSPLADELRANRPELTAIELDAIKRKVQARARTHAPSRRTQLMRSRLTILVMLVLGLSLSTAGAGLAITGATGNATTAVYGSNPGHESPDQGDVLGDNDSGGAPAGGTTTGSNQGSGVQPARQVETGANGGQLPFTGFAAIPVLVGGIALLGGGLVLRRRSADDRAS